MPLERYLGEGKMELLKREVESSTGIQLKTLPRCLINEDRLREAQTTGSKRGSAIVITVKGETEAKKLCASGLRFGGLVRVVEKFWEVGPSSVCMTCCGIGQERMGGCGSRPANVLFVPGYTKLRTIDVGVGIQHHAVAGIQGHAVAETPTGMARALSQRLSLLSSSINHTSYSTIPFIRL